MASPELQALMAQMRDFLAAMVQQQQTVMEAMERGRPAAQAQGINERYYKIVESFIGEQAWRDWSFQFKSATKTANEAAYHLIEAAEKGEKEVDDALSLSEEERPQHPRDFSQGRTPPDAAHDRIQWIRGVEKALQEVQPHDADEAHATHDGSHQPRQREGTRGGRDPHRQVGGQGLGTVTRFQRVAQWEDEGSHLDLHAAPRPPACADPAGRQDRGLQEHQRQSQRPSWRQSSHSRTLWHGVRCGPPVNWPRGSLGRQQRGLRCRRGEQQKRFVLLQVRRTRPHCSRVRYTRPNQGERERWRKGRKSRRQGRR